MSVRAYLGIGANLADARGALAQAQVELHGPDLRVLRRSGLYSSAPVGPQDQPRFFNAVLEIETTLSPESLLKRVKHIETEMGRTPTRRWGPRVIDIDIVLFGDLELQSPDLIIPHREMGNRVFVLAPLADLCPSLIVPGSTSSVQALLDALPRTEGDLDAADEQED